MGAAPSRSAVVEDSAFGVDAAIAAGMQAFAYAGGVTAADRLARPGVVVFDDMRRLPGLIKSAPLGP
jgi:beta-phosphoglucomutase-like phosphatase (HAD superfamily)